MKTKHDKMIRLSPDVREGLERLSIMIDASVTALSNYFLRSFLQETEKFYKELDEKVKDSIRETIKAQNKS